VIEISTPTTQFPAVQGCVGNRLVSYSTQVPPNAIEALLGHDPRSRLWKKLPGDIEAIYSKVQRATSTARLRNIEEYIQVRFANNPPILGAFPAVSIAVQNHIGFVPSADPSLKGLGNINIDMSSRNARIVVDGLGRLSGVLDLLEQSYDENLDAEEKAKLRELIQNFTLPLVIFAPHPDAEVLTRDEMGQLFFDFNFKSVAVPPRIAISLDRSDPYILATNALGKRAQAIARHGGVEERAASLGGKSKGIVVQQVLLRFVRGAMEGQAAQENAKAVINNPNLTLSNFAEKVDDMAEFIDAFASAMGDRWPDRKSLHLSAPGWQAIGLIYCDLLQKLHAAKPNDTAKAMARIDWNRSGPLWANIVTEKEMPDGTVELFIRGGGSSTKRDMADIVRNELGLTSLIEERAAA
jgi:DNA-sulfur modification-associated